MMDEELSHIFSVFLKEKDKLYFRVYCYNEHQFTLYGTPLRKVGFDFLEKGAYDSYNIKRDLPNIDFVISYVNNLYYFFTCVISEEVTTIHENFIFEGRICLAMKYKDELFSFYGFRLVTEHSLEKFKIIQNGRFTISHVRKGTLTKGVR